MKSFMLINVLRLFIGPACLASAILWLFSGAALAGGDDWRLEKDKDGVEVYMRDVEGSDYRAFRGVAIVPGELNQVMAVLDDTGNFSTWMHNCKQALLLEKRNLLDRVQYLQLDFPWPATDREMILRNQISQDIDSRVVTIELSLTAPEALSPGAQERLPAAGDHQRVAGALGRYVLTPLSESETRVEYEMVLDPGGALPAGLVNSQLVDNPYETLRALRKQVQLPRYQHFNPF
ncbi:START domain-containing protein [Spongiibacter nanhainus]|uniref:START domain-containing protein n=1 Tax=Spongiibacter nanhainus TaxID=2794344 RepID=A0A7T4R2P0_9GAMM|nr:START domain-containing protein [Spongiibacter nanhainus]QQD19344.1 START domain-containing protein [Spongiibacter nanhainus]